jgi:hypothetical protein
LINLTRAPRIFLAAALTDAHLQKGINNSQPGVGGPPTSVLPYRYHNYHTLCPRRISMTIPNKTPMSLTMQTELLTELRRLSRVTGIPMTRIIEVALLRYLPLLRKLHAENVVALAEAATTVSGEVNLQHTDG